MQKNEERVKDEVITQVQEILLSVSLFMEFQFASLETEIGMQNVSGMHTCVHTYTPSWCDPLLLYA